MSDYRLPFDQRLRFESWRTNHRSGTGAMEFSNIGQPQRSQGDPRILVQLTRLTIDVEEVTSRAPWPQQIPQPSLISLRIQARTRSGSGRPTLNIPMVGQRRICFLRPSQNTLTDPSAMLLNIISSCRVEPTKEGSARERIQAAALQKCYSFRDRASTWGRSSRTCTSAEYIASTLCSPAAAERLVTQLSQNPNKQISDGAQALLEALRVDKNGR